MPSNIYISVKLSKELMSRLLHLKFPGESWNHFLERLLPVISAGAEKQMRRLARRRPDSLPKKPPEE